MSAIALSKSYSTAKPTETRSNEPIRYVGSPAASWEAKKGRSGTVDFEQIPWFQTYAVTGSVAIFLIYFCILREENDVDKELEKSLYERVPGMEQTQLILSYKYNLENNIDNSEIITRMKELNIRAEDIGL